MPPRTLGPYELERQLGTGGFGAVWVGRHLQSGARHALKVIELGSPEEALRFQRESEALVLLGAHPGVVRIHSAFHAGSTAVIAMELIEGEDLQRRLVAGPLKPAEAVALVLEVASAVAHAHRRGVLHRDLKPANVIIDRQGRARLVDLGLAAVSGGRSLTRTGEVLGTPSYAAPEQVLGKGTDARTDVFGLGALLFACLTGRAPRDGGGAIALLARAAEEPPPPVESLRAEVPAALCALVRRATALAPGDRFRDVEELIAALEARPESGGAWLPVSAIAGVVAALVVAVALVAARGGGAPGVDATRPAAAPASEAQLETRSLVNVESLAAPASSRDALVIRVRLGEALAQDRREVRKLDQPPRNVRRYLLSLHADHPHLRVEAGRALREALADLTRRTPDWTEEGYLALALDAYRYYLFDPQPVPLHAPVSTPTQRVGWTYELARGRLGLGRVDPGELLGTDRELWRHCPRSRLLSLAELKRRTAEWDEAPPEDPRELVGLGGRAMGIGEVLDDLGGDPDIREQSEVALCVDAWWELSHVLLRLQGAEQVDAVSPFADRTAELVGQCLHRIEGLGMVAARAEPIAQAAVSCLRSSGAVTRVRAWIDRAIDLRRASLKRLERADERSLAIEARLALVQDLLALHELAPDPGTLAELDSITMGLGLEMWAANHKWVKELWPTLRARTLLACGQLDEAEAVLGEARRDHDEVALDVTSFGSYGLVHVELALAANEPDVARTRLEAARVRARAAPKWGAEPHLDRLEARLKR